MGAWITTGFGGHGGRGTDVVQAAKSSTGRSVVRIVVKGVLKSDLPLRSTGWRELRSESLDGVVVMMGSPVRWIKKAAASYKHTHRVMLAAGGNSRHSNLLFRTLTFYYKLRFVCPSSCRKRPPPPGRLLSEPHATSHKLR